MNAFSHADIVLMVQQKTRRHLIHSNTTLPLLSIYQVWFFFNDKRSLESSQLRPIDVCFSHFDFFDIHLSELQFA
jgi:hypothetical protein